MQSRRGKLRRWRSSRSRRWPMHNRRAPGQHRRPFTSMTELALVALASLFAGCVDAIVGGGGLILVPALFGMYPGAAPATLLGTNKGSGIWVWPWATWQFSRRVPACPGRRCCCRRRWPPSPAASPAPGAHARQPRRFAQGPAPRAAGGCSPTLARRDLGRHHAPRFAAAAQALPACTIGMVVGFYDGSSGPAPAASSSSLFVRWLATTSCTPRPAPNCSTPPPTLRRCCCSGSRAMSGGRWRRCWRWPTSWAALIGDAPRAAPRRRLRRVAFIAVVAALIDQDRLGRFVR